MIGWTILLAGCGRPDPAPAPATSAGSYNPVTYPTPATPIAPTPPARRTGTESVWRARPTWWAVPGGSQMITGLATGELGDDGVPDLAWMSFEEGSLILIDSERALDDVEGAARVDIDGAISVVAQHLALPGDLDGDGEGEIAWAVTSYCGATQTVAFLLYGPHPSVRDMNQCSLDPADSATFTGVEGGGEATVLGIEGRFGTRPWRLAVGGGGPGHPDSEGLVGLYDHAVFGVAPLEDAPISLRGVGRFGGTLETGDLDGDGVTELLVGASYDSSATVEGGAIWGFTDPAESRTTAESDFVLTAPEGAHIGDGLVAGDLTADGLDDVVTGTFDGKSQRGGWWVVPSSGTDELSLDDGILVNDDEWGVNVYAAGPMTRIVDLDADGNLDLVIALFQGIFSEQGRLLVRYGPVGDGDALDLYLPGGWLGGGLAVADWDGDARDDLAFLAEGRSPAAPDGDYSSGAMIISGTWFGVP